VDLEQQSPEWDFDSQIERACVPCADDLLALRPTARGGYVANALILQTVGGYVLDPLLRPGVALHENRAERFVALEQLHDGRCQTRTIEWSAEPDNRSDVIRRGVGLQLLEEPDSLLG